ncbi:hypothetical protein JHK86_021682 [Glycine max]|nr:hypothetical protein JHK86_021682 [Glycine max]
MGKWSRSGSIASIVAVIFAHSYADSFRFNTTNHNNVVASIFLHRDLSMAKRILALSNGDGVHQFFDELEAKKTILSKCTDLFTTLSTHFSSLQHSVTEKSQSFNSLSKETLEFVHLHKTFILKCESSAAAHIEEQREATLALQLTTPISISFFRSGSPSPSRNNVVFYSFFLFAHVNKGTVAVFAHYVCAMVVCWRCDL